MDSHFSHIVLSGFSGSVNPALVAVACNVYADEGIEGICVDAFVAMTYHGPVDLSGDDEDQRIVCGLEFLLDMGGVKEAERDVQGFTEASVGIVLDFSCVYDDPDP